MSSSKWTVMNGEGSESALRASDGASKSRLSAYDPAALPFDARKHVSVELEKGDQLFGLVLNHLANRGVVVDEDAVSFNMTRAEKGSKKQHACCGGAHSTAGPCDGDDSDLSLKSIAVSLGLGVFRFTHKGTEIKALHQHVGDPVGTHSGATVLSSLVLFAEGRGPASVHVIRRFLADVVADSEKTSANMFQVYRWHLQCQFWQIVTRVVARPVSSVVLPEDISAKLVDDMSEFLSEETATFYQEHGIPYKRAYLFHGVPGSGKTSMIQALAGKFGRNLCYLSPTHPDLSDDSLKSAIERVPDNAIVVLEDVDALFGKDREKKIQQSPLTFSGLLNALDGVGNHDGLVFVLTTNFKEQLDAALIRDGRVDMRVRFDYCTPHQMEKMFENFYPQVKAQPESKAAELNEDPEIAALEAKISALKKAKVKVAATTEDTPSSEVPPASGAAFRDALLLALGERKVTTAQLQHFFVTHRKCTAAEAIADVAAIAENIDERAKEEAEKDAGKGATKDAKEASGGSSGAEPVGAKDATQAAAGASVSGKEVHIHVHTTAS